MKFNVSLRSKRGKAILLYLLFVGIAFIFWLFLTLETVVQRDYEIPLEIVDKPDSAVILAEIPPTITVTIKSKELHLIKYTWGDIEPLKLKYNEIVNKGHLNITKSYLESRIQDYFGGKIMVLNFAPSGIKSEITHSRPYRLPLRVVSEVTPAAQYVLSSLPYSTCDSVDVYAVGDLPHNLREINTAPIIKSGLTDTLRLDVPLPKIPGIKIVPNHVNVIIPVEPLISRSRQVNISPINVPDSLNMTIFPSQVNVSFLVPISRYNSSLKSNLEVNADFNSRSESGKVPLTMGEYSSYYTDPIIGTDSVDFIIEHISHDLVP